MMFYEELNTTSPTSVLLLRISKNENDLTALDFNSQKTEIQYYFEIGLRIFDIWRFLFTSNPYIGIHGRNYKNMEKGLESSLDRAYGRNSRRR